MMYLQNNDISKTLIVVTDKDMAEIAAVKEIFPNAQQFVCIFHVLQAVNRRMQTARLLPDYFTEIDLAFHEAVYTLNPDRFSTLQQELCSVENDKLGDYFRTNWFEWKPELWALHRREGALSFGNNTNNRIERYTFLGIILGKT